MSYLGDYAYTAGYAAAGIFMVLTMISISWVLQPKKPGEKKLSPYECGSIPFGGEWSQFNVRFYVFALLFLIFDVEIAFIYPWATIFKELGLASLIEMLVFIAILLIGLIYAWKKGVLRWI